jgi:DNA-binding HxlR family transcriptional regulator
LGPEQILSLDPVIHAPNRLAIISILVTVDAADFAFLKESTGITDGNLSTHLARLETEGYIDIQKTFRGKKPHTVCKLTEKGRQSFYRYLALMEQIVGMKEHVERNPEKASGGD